MKLFPTTPGPHAPRRGFTVIEVLLAISAFMLLAAVLLSILRIIDRTRAAGASLSSKTTISTMLEQRLRQDFDRMSRDGFLVIRNRLSPLAPLSNGLASAQRRIDEILFFTAGSSGTVRSAIDPGRNARGQAASIYIGHGLPRGSDAANPASLTDDNSTAPKFGAAGLGAGNGLSRYAKDWILARVPLTLTSPANPAIAVLRGTTPSVASADLDSPIQIALQPAAPSLFRTINLTATGLVQGVRQSVAIPLIASGTIDLVAQDLPTIRQIMLAGKPDYRLSNSLPETWQGTGTDRFPLEPLNTTLSDIEIGMNRLMLDALPADSALNRRVRVELQAPPAVFPNTELGQSQRDDATMLTTTALLPGVSEFIVEWSYGVTYGPGAPDETKVGSVIWHGMTRRNDPETQLAGDPRGSVAPFTGRYPRTAFGDVGTLVAARETSAAGGGVARLVVDASAIGTASFENIRLSGPALVAAKTAGGDSDRRVCIMYPRIGMLPGLHEMSKERVHGDSGRTDADPVDSFFGYFDTRYRPLFSRVSGDPNYPAQLALDRNGDDRLQDTDAERTILLRDVNGNGRYDPLDGDQLSVPDTLPAAWPAQIRITIRYAGVGVPTGSEQTFVYVFKTPGVFPAAAN